VLNSRGVERLAELLKAGGGDCSFAHDFLLLLQISIQQFAR
jgi:hypothetical protein